MPATTTREKNGFDFGVVIWGFTAVFLITAPLWMGFVAYLIAKLFGSSRAEIWGEGTGWAALLAAPAIILGKALNASYVGDADDKPVSDEDS